MKTQIISVNDPRAFTIAKELLERGELVAFPTDTVYGVGASVHNKQGINNLYVAKLRDTRKAIPILLGTLAEVSQVTSGMSGMALQLAQHFWPGPLTLVVPRRTDLMAEISPYPTIGVRMPNHPDTLRLLRLMGPMAVTSANLSGQASTCSVQAVLAQLGGRIALILDGGLTPGGNPSTVVDCSGAVPVILREGPVHMEDIEKVLHLE